jgi:small subunit ribosomal protein S6
VHTYETLFITPPTLTEEEEQATVAGMAQIVTDGGGSFVVNERMGRRRLAYPIQKHEDGVYVRFLYDAAPEVPRELERRIRLSDQVIRSLTIRLEEDWAVAAKEEAVKEAERRAKAEAERKAEEAEAERKAAEEAAKKEAEAESAAPSASDDTESESTEENAAKQTDADSSSGDA